MKKLNTLFSLAVVFSALVLFSSCGSSGGDDGPSPEEVRGALLAKTWTMSSVTKAPDNKQLEFQTQLKDLTFTITYGATSTISVTGDQYPTQTDPANLFAGLSSWSFKGTDLNTLAVNATHIPDGEIAIAVGTEGTLTLTFDAAAPAFVKPASPRQSNRVKSATGEFVIVLTPATAN